MARQDDKQREENQKAQREADDASPRERRQEVDRATEQVQERADEETAQGYRGTVPDPTPNRNYTAEGQAEGAPTPETDPELAREVGSRRFAGSAAEAEKAQDEAS